MRVYNVSSDPAIGAQDIRIAGDQVAIVLSKYELEWLKTIAAIYTRGKPRNSGIVDFAYELSGRKET